MNFHVRAKPLPSHQLKNNTLGFGKNVILGGLCSLRFWLFKAVLVLSFQRTSSQPRNFPATSSRNGDLKNISQSETWPCETLAMLPTHVAALKASKTQEANLSKTTGRQKASLLPQWQVPYRHQKALRTSQQIDCLKFKPMSLQFMTDFTLLGNTQGKNFSLFHAKLLPTGFREVLHSLGTFLLQVF